MSTIPSPGQELAYRPPQNGNSGGTGARRECRPDGAGPYRCPRRPPGWMRALPGDPSHCGCAARSTRRRPRTGRARPRRRRPREPPGSRGHEERRPCGRAARRKEDRVQAGRHVGGRPGPGRRGHRRASGTTLNGVATAVRHWVKPAWVSTSPSPSGPAWAPRPNRRTGPASWECTGRRTRVGEAPDRVQVVLDPVAGGRLHQQAACRRPPGRPWCGPRLRPGHPCRGGRRRSRPGRSRCRLGRWRRAPRSAPRSATPASVAAFSAAVIDSGWLSKPTNGRE